MDASAALTTSKEAAIPANKLDGTEAADDAGGRNEVNPIKEPRVQGSQGVPGQTPRAKPGRMSDPVTTRETRPTPHCSGERSQGLSTVIEPGTPSNPSIRARETSKNGAVKPGHHSISRSKIRPHPPKKVRDSGVRAKTEQKVCHLRVVQTAEALQRCDTGRRSPLAPIRSKPTDRVLQHTHDKPVAPHWDAQHRDA